MPSRGFPLIPRSAVLLLTIVLSATAPPAAGQASQPGRVPHPREVVGFTPGDDYLLADFGQMQAWFQALDRASDRVRLTVAGRSAEGRDILLAVISSSENLARIERYRDISRRLALARGLDDEAARQLAREGKSVVWIDNGLHAAETAHAQHSFLLAYRVATEESDEMRRIRDQVVLLLLPSVNPDGLDLVADWYRRTVRTPYQDSPMPWLFNRYSGYENNRDAFMQNDVETRVMNRLLYVDWLPQIVYNHHQGFPPTRIFVPPFPDPFNPNIDPQVIREIGLVGSAMQNRFEREGKDGVISGLGFSAWYNGSVRTTASFHNMIGILSETTHDSPTPFEYDLNAFPDRFGNGWPVREPTVNYPRPWRGGTLRFKDAVDYMLTGSLAVLDVAARYREELLYGMYQKGARQIELGRSQAPGAFVIPVRQHDLPVAARFVEILMLGGVEVHRAEGPFEAAGRSFGAGSWVVRMDQPFRPFAKDLLEPQRYPDVRLYPGGPPVPPYDNAGWTLAYQMGVDVVPLDRAPAGRLVRLDAPPRVAGTIAGAGLWGYVISPRENNASTAALRLISEGIPVSRAGAEIVASGVRIPAGAFVVRADPRSDGRIGALGSQLGLAVTRLAREPEASLRPLSLPRIGVYRSWVVEWVDDWTASEGWTRFVLEGHGFPYERLANSDVREGGLGSRYDVIVIPNQNVDDVIGGYRQGRPQFGPVHQALPPPEYQGGIGREGVAALRTFVEGGGTLVLVDASADLATREFRLPVRDVLAGLPQDEFFGPGSVVRVTVDPSHPVGWGMPPEADAYFRKGRAYVTTDPSVRSIVRYAERGVLRSGWLMGEDHIAGRHAAVEVPMGRGRVIMFGFPPYFRGQPHGTFKLFLNALLLGRRD